MCPFDDTAVAGGRKVGPVKQVNHTSWVALVTPTDRPKSVRNRKSNFCVGLFVLSLCPFDISVGVGAAVVEWLNSWLAEQEDRGSIPGLATWIFRDWLSPASKSRYG